MRFLAPALVLLSCLGCASGDRVTVVAASSLADVLPRAAEAGGFRPRFSFAASSTLALQLEQGMTADLYLAADPAWADSLKKKGLGSREQDVARNVLALLCRAGLRGPTRPEELADPRWGRIAVGGPQVPAGRYAREVLAPFHLEHRFLSCRDAQAVVSTLASGEVKLAVAYRTDARLDPGIAVCFLFDRPGDPDVVYRALLLRDRPQARRLFSFLGSDAARKIFREAGFLAPKR